MNSVIDKIDKIKGFKKFPCKCVYKNSTELSLFLGYFHYWMNKIKTYPSLKVNLKGY